MQRCFLGCLHTNRSVCRQAMNAAALARELARDKLLDAALSVIRTKGYERPAIDELCPKAGRGEGRVLPSLQNKEALAVAAAEYWSEKTGALFEAAPYHAYQDPLDRVLGYIDFRKAILTGSVPEFTCLVGTMVQEVYETWPAIREACDASISGHAAKVEADIAGSDQTSRHSRRLDGAQPRAPHASGSAGRIHPGEGERRRRRCRRKHRSSASLYRTACFNSEPGKDRKHDDRPCDIP